jgi:hypothetical protein
MSVRNSNGPIFLFLFFCALTGCVSTRAPSGWLAPAESLPTDVYGGWIKLHTKDLIGYENTHRGEFIGIRDSSVFLLTEKGELKMISMKNVRNANLYIHQNYGSEAALTTLAGTASTISGGFALIITAPIWIITGTILTINASFKGNYSQHEPDSAWWNSVKQFARFPQGPPENITYSPLKTKQRK